MGPIWGRQDPGGPHVDPSRFAIWDVFIEMKHANQYNKYLQGNVVKIPSHIFKAVA